MTTPNSKVQAHMPELALTWGPGHVERWLFAYVGSERWNRCGRKRGRHGIRGSEGVAIEWPGTMSESDKDLEIRIMNCAARSANLFFSFEFGMRNAERIYFFRLIL